MEPVKFLKPGDYKDTEVSRYLISTDKKSCRNCGKKTHLIDIYTEAYLCSDKCNKSYMRMLYKGVDENAL